MQFYRMLIFVFMLYMQSCVGLTGLFDRVLGLDISPGQVELAIKAVQADNIQFQVNI
jgi:hypothetical protein